MIPVQALLTKQQSPAGRYGQRRMEQSPAGRHGQQRMVFQSFFAEASVPLEGGEDVPLPRSGSTLPPHRTLP